jgi:hypothetical protein
MEYHIPSAVAVQKISGQTQFVAWREYITQTFNIYMPGGHII